MDVRVGLWGKLSTEKLMLLNDGVGDDSWESLGLQGDPTSPSQKRSVLGVNWKDGCWSWNSNSLATSCKDLTHWKRPWCQEELGTGRDGDDRRWDGWMASPTRWTWVWVNSRSWWWTGRPGVLQIMGLQRVRQDWATELNWTDWSSIHPFQSILVYWFLKCWHSLLPSPVWPLPFALIHGPNIPGSYATLLFIASDFTSITSHIQNWVLFLLYNWSCLFYI